MNIFVTNESPVIAAQDMCDKHLIKMILETAQILSTVCKEVYDYEGDALYKSCYVKHPATLWAGQSYTNFCWLLEHGLALCHEYYFRFQKHHKSETVLDEVIKYMSDTIFTWSGVTNSTPEFVQIMPDEFKKTNTCIAYQNYLLNKFENNKPKPKWTKRDPPEWYK